MPIQKLQNTRSKTPTQIPDPELALREMKFAPSRQGFEAALSQLEFGQTDVAALHSSLTDSQSYGALLRRGYQLISKTMSPGQIMDVLARITFEALSAGWIAHESAVQSKLLERMVLNPTTAVPANPPNRRTRRAGGSK